MIEILFDNRAGVSLSNEFFDTVKNALNAASNEKLDKDKNYEVSVSFVDKEEIQSLNKTYRDKDSVTDVLSFPMDFEDEDISDIICLGDIVICVDRVKEQAGEFCHSEEREAAYLSVHSFLHLIGYDHIDEEDKIIMRREEESIMDILNLNKDK